MISEFRGKYAFLSNFMPASVEYEGMLFPTVEHAYQAAKTTDKQLRQKISHASTAALAKKIGRSVPLRAGWDEIKLIVMFNLVEQKFTKHKWMHDALLETGDQELVEGNTWGDSYWGKVNGEGHNWLGKILMSVRRDIREELKSATQA